MSDRVVAVDALRGFALFGIIVVHFVEQYLGAPPPPSRPDFGIFSPADTIVQAVDGLLFVGKFFPMFSLLFGLSFFIQMDRAARKGADYEWRFVWRVVLLLVMGLLHGLVYRGDILSIYASLGLVLVLFHRASDRTLLVSAMLLLVGLPRLVLVGVSTAMGQPFSLVPGDPAALDAYFSALKSGSVPAIFASNITDGLWMKLEFQFGLFGRGYQTLGLFLIGLYAGRHGWHESLRDLGRVLRRVLIYAAAIAVVAAASVAVLGATGNIGRPETMGRWQTAAFLFLYDTFNLSLAAILTSVFLLVYQRPRARRVLQRLAPVGQTALTSYVCQTLVGTFFYYGWGLNRLGEIGAATALVIAVVVFGVQIAIADVWLRYFRFGPLEWLWRSLTWGRRQPFRTVATSPAFR